MEQHTGWESELGSHPAGYWAEVSNDQSETVVYAYGSTIEELVSDFNNITDEQPDFINEEWDIEKARALGTGRGYSFNIQQLGNDV